MMWMMLQQDEADDYVVATNEAHSVKEFVVASFEHVGIELEWSGTVARVFKRDVFVLLLSRGLGSPTCQHSATGTDLPRGLIA
jgi:GDP-D-mannose dehydratase